MWRNAILSESKANLCINTSRRSGWDAASFLAVLEELGASFDVPEHPMQIKAMSDVQIMVVTMLSYQPRNSEFEPDTSFAYNNSEKQALIHE